MSIKNQDNQPADLCLPAKFVAFLINFYGLFLGGLWALIFIGGVYCMVYAQPGLSAIWNPKTEVVAWFSLLAMLAGLVGVAVGLFWGLRQLRGFGWRFRLAFGVFATTGPVFILASISLFRQLVPFVPCLYRTLFLRYRDIGHPVDQIFQLHVITDSERANRPI